MKKLYEAPKIMFLPLTYEVVYSKKCHFADYQECSVSAQEFK